MQQPDDGCFLFILRRVPNLGKRFIYLNRIHFFRYFHSFQRLFYGWLKGSKQPISNLSWVLSQIFWKTGGLILLEG